MPKTIFGTTERSNFILNMKSETLQKWIHGVLACCIIIPLIGAAVLTLLAKINYFSAAILYATGFTCILFFLIVMLKQDMRFKDSKSYLLIIALALTAVISYYGTLSRSADYIKVALLGNLGRYEGLLSILSYLGIFLLATAVSKESTVERLFDLLVGAGTVEAFVALLQHLPLDFNTSDYRNLPTIAYENVFLSSGLTGSPIFYGAITTLTGAVAIVGAVYSASKRRAKLYAAAALFIFLTGMFTGSVVPLIGEAAVILTVIIIEAVNSAKFGGVRFDGKLLNTSLKRAGAMVAALIVTFVIVLFTQGFYFRDRPIAFYDSFYRLFISNTMSLTDRGKGNIPYTVDFWKEQWGYAVETANASPVMGVGPDCLALARGQGANINDKCYNEFLYIAATRGYISLAAYVTLIISTIVVLCKKMKLFFGDKTKWYIPCMMTAVIGYIIQSCFNASAITTAPFFWLMLGMVWSTRIGKKNDNG